MTATTANALARRNPLDTVLAGPVGSFDAYVDARQPHPGAHPRG